MTASITFFQNWRKAIGGAVDLNSLTAKATLHTSSYTPSASGQSVYADVTNELSTANGYTNGGLALSSITWTVSGATATLTSAALVWTASGGSIVARYAVLRAIGTFNTQVDPLIAYILMDTTPADVTTTTTNTLTLTPNASGIFTVT